MIMFPSLQNALRLPVHGLEAITIPPSNVTPESGSGGFSRSRVSHPSRRRRPGEGSIVVFGMPRGEPQFLELTAHVGIDLRGEVAREVGGADEGVPLAGIIEV
jgi:hypothetical protein